MTVVVDSEFQSHFNVTYESGAPAEVSWSFVTENARVDAAPTARVAETPES